VIRFGIGQIIVMNRTLELLEDLHTVYLNPDNGSVYQDLTEADEYIKLFKYEYSKDPLKFEVKENYLEKFTDTEDFSDIDDYNISRYMYNGRMVGNAPFYGNDMVATQYLEGFPVSFDYNNFVFSTISLASYSWTAGRVCNNFGIFSSEKPIAPWTVQTLTNCIGSPMLWINSIGLLISGYGFANMGLVQNASFTWSVNEISIAKFYYVHRRYTYAEINSEILFKIKQNKEEIDVSPIGELEEVKTASPNWNNSLSFLRITR